MIHQPLGGAQGQAADIEIQANEIMVSLCMWFTHERIDKEYRTAPQVYVEWLSCRIYQETVTAGSSNFEQITKYEFIESRRSWKIQIEIFSCQRKRPLSMVLLMQ